LKSENINLKEELEELQSYSRINNLELHGIPERNSESIQDLVLSVAKALGVELSPGDIDAAHRIGTSKVKLPPPIVVKFISRQVRGAILSAYKNKRNRKLTTKHINVNFPERNIYINEHLTKQKENPL